MHRLLRRQLARSPGIPNPPPPDWQHFLTLVDSAYTAADADRSLLENALDITSRELLARNEDLRRDLADREKVADALRLSEERYRLLFEVSPDGIAIHRAGIITLMNPAGVRLLGAKSADEILGKPLLMFVHADYQTVVTERVQTMITTGQQAPVREETFVRLDGTPFAVEVTATPFFFDHEPAVQVIFRDISARKHAEAERLAIERQLRETQRLESLGLLAGGIAHDFNNLLTAILGNAELARAELAPNSPTRQSIDNICLASRRAADLVQHMLAYAGKSSVAIEPLDMVALVNEMVLFLRAAISKTITLRTDVPAYIPAITADATQIRQVVLNVLTNAADAIGDREGRISLTLTECAADARFFTECVLMPDSPAERYVALSVSDTGQGMSAETRERMFEPFFTTKFTGRGLGLAAVLGIMRAHQGAIHIASTPGQGTCVRLLFPVVAQSVAEPVSEVETIPHLEHGTLLIVDDESAVRGVVARMLVQEGFTILTAEDGRDGVAVFQREAAHIDCLLLDMTMPGLNGVETFRRVREIRPNVPVVLMSGYSGMRVMEHIQDAPRMAFLAKPFTKAQLRAAMGKALAGT